MVEIKALPSADGLSCTFELDRDLAPPGLSLRFMTGSYSYAGTAGRLLALAGVRQVLVKDRRIRVAAAEGTDWRDLGAKVGNLLREDLEQGPLVWPLSPETWTRVPSSVTAASVVASAGGAARSSEDRVEEIQKVLNEHINPQIASHSGFIRAERVEGSTLWVSLEGGCQGCRASQATLKQGVERVVLAHFPSITEVKDQTDHEQGENPYYA